MHHILCHLRQVPVSGAPCHLAITGAQVSSTNDDSADWADDADIDDYGRGEFEVFEGCDPAALGAAFPHHIVPLQQWAQYRSGGDVTPVLLSVVIGRTRHVGVFGIPARSAEPPKLWQPCAA